MVFDVSKLKTTSEIVTDVGITQDGQYTAKVNGVVIVTSDFGHIKGEIERVLAA